MEGGGCSAGHCPLRIISLPHRNLTLYDDWMMNTFGIQTVSSASGHLFVQSCRIQAGVQPLAFFFFFFFFAISSACHWESANEACKTLVHLEQGTCHDCCLFVC